MNFRLFFANGVSDILNTIKIKFNGSVSAAQLIIIMNIMCRVKNHQ